MDAAAIAGRLKATVPGLRRVGVAADLMSVLEGKLADPNGTSAFVIGAGARGGVPDVMAGAFVQLVTETVSVVLTLRSIDNRAGDRAVDELEELKAAVRAALAGWAPPGAFDVMALSAERVVSFVPGFFAYALEFTTSDQLRILE